MVDASAEGTFGRFAEPALDDMTAGERQAYDYTARERGMIPGPHKIWLCNPALETAMVPIGAYYQKHLTLSPAEREIVNNMTNGHWAAAAYSNFEHELLGQKAGLPGDKVAALIAGLPVTFDDERQQVVHDVTATLVAGRRLPRALFDRAVEKLGHPGLCDVTVLIGYFTSVSLSLVAYDVPSHATGRQQEQPPATNADRSKLSAATAANGLGGRFELYDPASLTGSARALYDHAKAVVVPEAERVGFIAMLDDGRLIGPFNSMLASPDLSTAVLALQKAEGNGTSLNRATRQVVILSVGAILKAPYEIYAHTAEARAAGLSGEVIDALVRADVAEGLGEADRIAQRFTLALVRNKHVADDLFLAARETFGQKGIVDLIILAGCYQLVCSLLIAVAVPVPQAEGQSHAAR